MTTTIPIRTKRTGQRGALWLSFEPKNDRTVLAGRYTSSPLGAVRANYPDGSGIPEVQITKPLRRHPRRRQPGAGDLARTRLLGHHPHLGGEQSLSRRDLRAARPLSRRRRGVPRVPAAPPDPLLRLRLPAGDHLPTSAGLHPHHLGCLRRRTRGTFREILLHRPPQPDTDIERRNPGSGGRVRTHRGTEWFGGYPYTAAGYILAPRNLESLAETLHDLLADVPGALASSSALSSGICAIRALTNDAHTLYRLLNRSRDLARRSLGLPVPAREIM
jgi:hypothetical protein